MVDLDKRRQTNRQALRAVRNKDDNKSYVMFGSEFLKIGNTKISEWLEQDQQVLEEELEGLRSGLKVKVADLKKLEGEEVPRGFDLKPMSPGEIMIMNKD